MTNRDDNMPKSGRATMTRRAALRGLALASATAGVGGHMCTGAAAAEWATPAGATALREMTARERYDHHLAELKRAAEEIDPRIALWSCHDTLGDTSSAGVNVSIAAHLRRGRYEGDGLYSTQSSTVYVKLLDQRQAGQRMFSYSGYDARAANYEIPEDRLEAFIGHKISGCDAPGAAEALLKGAR